VIIHDDASTDGTKEIIKRIYGDTAFFSDAQLKINIHKGSGMWRDLIFLAAVANTLPLRRR
jgi:glycosyltransferase involved in cell wall biosynthesis